ncbi:DNA topoisomerase 2-alpha-like [Stegodyphus dumicola]|uniref:DNA topoisomerase 2-alpha-like n=1 Tax=Stegodyphus dumicola TaxID=202533 RepID=UPI0015AAFAAE|nr:DNA topoisomerase 2-alpha-like [Stegodyphus dumicola]
MADLADLSDEWDMDEVPQKTQKANKKLSVERIYQKKTQLEHILLRPDTYIGSVEPVTQLMWVYDEDVGMVNREVTFVPGLYKIFDEILVNAADNKQRDKNMDCIKIEINPEKNLISIWNNGQGIPVVEHKDEKMFVPSLIFGHLLTSSNYNDDERKVTGGRNGYGAKLCNIFSTKFTVETACQQYGKTFKQTWTDNMTKTEDPKIGSFKGSDFTCVTFYPDLAKFKMTVLEKDIVALMTRRAFDVAGCTRGVKVFLNGKRLPIKGFKDYMELYVKDKTDDQGDPLKIVHEVVNERWEIAVTLSNHGFQQVSFVNSIATTKGGRHVDYIADQLTSKIAEVVKKKNKGGKAVKPFQIKSYLWIFINCLIENPTFDSQTKENMTLQVKSFGSKCQLTEKFVNATLKCGVVEAIVQWVRFKAQTELEKKCSGKKHSKLKGIPKLEDANDAGTRNSIDCTLILTEGDSAKSLAVSGLGVVGRDKFGIFPLKGKILNVREASHKQILENAEINNIIKIMGLQYKKKYQTMDDLKTLRYGRLMVMTDQDQDGSHIKGLLINFIHHNWPDLLRLPFLEEFITPIVKATKGKDEKSFYSLPEFEEWKKETPNWSSYKVKYYKGLGTSTAKEAKEYFSDMRRHRIQFHYGGTDDDNAIQLAFSKKMVDMRKEWLSNGMEERKRRRELGLPEMYLYAKGTTKITYNDFVNKELILFSNMDNERSIPSVVDGLKPGQRKVLYTCIKRNDKREVKVAQLAGSVAEHSAYHHGEQSLNGTIINLAQNFVGSNNINILLPIGQFGTRLQGGKDAASPRYIFTMLSPLAKHIFSNLDTPLLKHLYDDNLKIEPEYYVPIIPMVLVNGAEGIGTGWSTKIPNYNPRDIVKNIYRMLNGEEPVEMKPWFKNFRGTIERLDNQHYVVSGEVALLGDNKIEITELPVRVWTQAYKESVLEVMLHGTDKTPPFITDYKEYHTDTTVRFVVTMTPEKMAEARNQGLHKAFKLQTTIATSSMVLFDNKGCLRKYDSPEQILKEFFEVRFALYERRKEYLVGVLEAESLKLKNQARFILEKIENKITIENRKKVEMIRTLQERGYDSDPVKAWKEAQKNLENDEDQPSSDTESEVDSSGPDYDYLLGMTLWSLTREKKEELLKKRDEKLKELEDLKCKSPSDLWRNDLKEFEDELDKVEKKEDEDEADQPKVKAKLGGGKKRKVAEESKPSIFGERIMPIIDDEYKKKFEKKPAVPGEQKKGRKKKDAEMKKGDDDDDKDGALSSLAERVATPEKKRKGAKDATKQPLIKTFKKSPATKSPKKAKKNPWSDSESNEEISDVSDVDADDYIPPEKREMAPRRAAAKAKYTFDSDEENGMKDDDSADEAKSTKSESDVDSPPPVNANNKVSDQPEERLNGASSPIISDSDDSFTAPTNTNDKSHDDIFDSLLGAKPDSKPNNEPPETQKYFSDSDSNSDSEQSKKPIAKAAPKKRPRKKSDGSSDDDFKPQAKKETVAKEKKAAPKKKAEDGVKKTARPKAKEDGPKKAARPKAKKQKKDSDSDDDFGDKMSVDGDDLPTQAVRQPRGGRTKAPIKYDFGDDSSDGY